MERVISSCEKTRREKIERPIFLLVRKSEWAELAATLERLPWVLECDYTRAWIKVWKLASWNSTEKRQSEESNLPQLHTPTLPLSKLSKVILVLYAQQTSQAGSELLFPRRSLSLWDWNPRHSASLPCKHSTLWSKYTSSSITDHSILDCTETALVPPISFDSLLWIGKTRCHLKPPLFTQQSSTLSNHLQVI